MIGEYLKTLRTKRKLSQRALAEKSGISNAEISRIESGERKKPSEEVLRALALALEVDLDHLLEQANLYRYNMLDKARLRLYREQCEERFVNIITPKIFKEGFNMSLSEDPFLGNIVATKDNYIWRIRFITMNEINTEYVVNRYLMEIYGYLSFYNEFNISKFTIATHSEDAFIKFKKKKPINLNILISIMLVNLRNNEIVDEYIFEKTPTIDSVY